MTLLDKHNEYRQRVASGSEDSQPGATNMRKLVWDEELATIAQRWSSQCIHGNDGMRDLCDGTPVGQNIWQSSDDYEYYAYYVNPDIGDAVANWYSQMLWGGFDSTNINPYVYVIYSFLEEIFIKYIFRLDQSYSHYTALMWAETDRVGCGRVYYEVRYNICFSLIQ